jgi:TolB protein
MTKKTLFVSGLALAAIVAMAQNRILIEIAGNAGKGVIALPEFRGSGEAQRFMGAFNSTLWSEIEGSGLFRMAPRTSYPLQAPQQPQDIRGGQAPPAPAPPKRGAPAPAQQPSGMYLSDWAGPPVSANYMAFGYTAAQNGRLVLMGYFYNVTQPDAANAQVFGKIYNGSLDEAGATAVAREFAADILKQFGMESLAGSKIIFVSTRTGAKEIWAMDYDGKNQRPITKYRSISTTPAVSPDGTRLAFTTYARGQPTIEVFSLETLRKLPFFNQNASMNATPSFTPDGRRIAFSSTLAGGYAQIYIADVNGSNLDRLTSVRAVEVEPKVNPKTGREIVFVSGRSGPQQIYRMNVEGTDIVRLTTGEGEASNPAWHPDGQHIAFAWTRGFEPGNFNVFLMNVATREYVQLTHGAGRNENPTWAPDGRHIVFASKRGGRTHIYTMLADGTQVKQLTTQGENTMPVWSR